MHRVHVLMALASLINFSCNTVSPHKNNLQGASDFDVFEPWPDRRIEVCWATHELGDMSRFQKAIEIEAIKEFGRADIIISGWKDCPNPRLESDPVPIYFGRDGNYTANIGYKSRVDGVHLDPVTDVYETGFPNSCTLPGQTFIKLECIVSTAIHELGHMVGLEHEHERLDTWNRCPYVAFKGKLSVSNFGDFDVHSRMNYCVDFDYLFGRKPLETSLSEGDIATIQALYNGTATSLKTNVENSNPFIQQENLIVNIQSPQIVSYRYQIATGTDIKDIPCALGSYSRESLPSTQEIKVNLKSLPEGVVKICVLGKNKNGIEQDPSVYSSVSFIIDRSPTAKFINRPLDETVRPSTELKVGGDSIVSYIEKIQWASSKNPIFANEEEALKFINPCLDEEGYSKPKPISENLKIPKPYQAKNSQLNICLRGIDSKGKIQSSRKATQELYIFKDI